MYSLQLPLLSGQSVLSPPALDGWFLKRLIRSCLLACAHPAERLFSAQRLPMHLILCPQEELVPLHIVMCII